MSIGDDGQPLAPPEVIDDNLDVETSDVNESRLLTRHGQARLRQEIV
jgi:hypothetical protein